MELRFHIPSSELAGDDPVENFKDQVMGKASIISATGDAIAIFREIQCLTPRYMKKQNLIYNFVLSLSNVNINIFAEVVMISKCTNRFSNFTVKHLTTRFQCPPYFVYSYSHTRTVVRCSIWSVWIHQLNRDRLVTII